MPHRKTGEQTRVILGLSAAIVAVQDGQPLILAVPRHGHKRERADFLPFGPFNPVAHRTMEMGLRAWVEEQTGLKLGYVEQLYTFGDRGRHAKPEDQGSHEVSVGYLALAREAAATGPGSWRKWYEFFPWEDWRGGKPAILDEQIEPLLRQWAALPETNPGKAQGLGRQERLRLFFGLDGLPWDEEGVLERYELLYEAGIVPEARRDGRGNADLENAPALPLLGQSMQHDHRRILATAMGRLRGKLKYRPVIFELMPPEFTLYELQRAVEAISGGHLHKQNFRRLVEKGRVVEPTGSVSTRTGGRPAALFRFRREVLRERPAPGLRVKAIKG
jgi:hypothetical protein